MAAATRRASKSEWLEAAARPRPMLRGTVMFRKAIGVRSPIPM
jgi:hypothetical protein